MTQEQKDLLLKDLSARLPYGVKVNAPFTSNKSENAKGYKINGIKFGVVEWTPILFGEKKQRNSIVIEAFSEKYNQYCSIDIELDNNIEEVKPYLFPLSSMTDEQKEELLEIVVGKEGSKYFKVLSDGSICSTDAKEQDLNNFVMHIVNFDRKTTASFIDWLYKHHFDFRGLIEKSLALDATGLNIY